MSAHTSIQEVREQIDELDRHVVQMIADRMQLVAKIGELKRGASLPTRDFQREKECHDNVVREALKVGVSPHTALSVLSHLIEASLTKQEKQRIQHSNVASTRALIIGGAGKMGQWFARYLQASGMDVAIADPAGSVEGLTSLDSWEADTLDFDFICVAVGLRQCNAVLQKLAEKKPRGIVFDIASLKEPLHVGISALKNAGVRCTSLHPMFGPTTELLSGRHLILARLGVEEADDAIKQLFAHTMANVAVMSPEQHDKLMAILLTLSHATNIAFADAVAKSGESSRHLRAHASTTFAQQLRVAENVVNEDPRLYFDIQALNRHSLTQLGHMRDSIDELMSALSSQNEKQFSQLMHRGFAYLAEAT